MKYIQLLTLLLLCCHKAHTQERSKITLTNLETNKKVTLIIGNKVSYAAGPNNISKGILENITDTTITISGMRIPVTSLTAIGKRHNTGRMGSGIALVSVGGASLLIGGLLLTKSQDDGFTLFSEDEIHSAGIRGVVIGGVLITTGVILLSGQRKSLSRWSLVVE